MSRAARQSLLGLAAVVIGGTALAQEYPAKPIRWVVPFPPGGSVDGVARRIGPALAAKLGQQVVLDNRTGASGNIAAELVARAPGDGYTVMNHTVPFVVNTFLYARVPYDVLRDFAPVSLLGSTPSMLTVHPSVPVHTVKDLIALARAKPGALFYGSAGIGTNPHICGELLNHLAKIDLKVVHFKGGAPARIATIAGELPMTFTSVLETVPQVKAGRLRGIAVTSLKRTAVLPDTPTMSESGVPGYEFVAWHGLVAPKGTPAAVTRLLRDRIKEAVSAPELAKQLADQGIDMVASTPEEFGAFLQSELRKWAPVVKERNMRAD
jgi:tripartite-type tricarboxylate transporter receptor subunit TctC